MREETEDTKNELYDYYLEEYIAKNESKRNSLTCDSKICIEIIHEYMSKIVIAIVILFGLCILNLFLMYYNYQEHIHFVREVESIRTEQMDFLSKLSRKIFENRYSQ